MKQKHYLIFILSFVMFFSSAPIWAAENLATEIRESASKDPEGALTRINELLTNKDLNNTDKLEFLLIKSEVFLMMGYMEEYQKASKKGLDFAINHENFEYEIRFRLNYAESFSQMSEWQKSKELYNETMLKLENSSDEKLIADAKAKYGLSSYYNSEFQSSLRMLSEAFEAYTTISPEQVAVTLANIALVFDATGEHRKAIEYFKKSLEYYDEEELESDAAITYYNIGFVSVKIEELDQAEFYLNKAEKIARKNNIVQAIAFIACQQGIIDIKRANYESAKSHLNESLVLAEELNNTRLQGRALRMLLKTSVRLKEMEQALSLYKRLEAGFMNTDDRNKLEIMKLKAEMNLERQEFSLAVDDYKEVARILEVIMENQKTKEIREMQGMFDNRLKEQENEILKQQNELQRLKISKQKSQALIYIIGSGGLVVTVVFLIMFWRREKQVRKKFTELAMVDELTGVANRRNIVQQAETEFKRFVRSQTKVAFCILDLDFFKKINDTYGHDVGDVVLIEFAKIVTSVIREHDAFGRIGGEEWLLVLSQIEEENINIVFNRISELSRKITIPRVEQEITFSMGVSLPSPEDNELEVVLKRADQALYDAKENGRNCYVVRANDDL